MNAYSKYIDIYQPKHVSAFEVLASLLILQGYMLHDLRESPIRGVLPYSVQLTTW